MSRGSVAFRLSAVIVSCLILTDFHTMPSWDQRELMGGRPSEELSATLSPSAELTEIDGVKVLLSNGVPLPSLELQEGRTYLPLNGTWKYLSSNASSVSLQRRDESVITLLEASGFHLAEFDDSNWSTIDVPSSPTRRGGPIERHEGVIWYRTKFFSPVQLQDEAAILVFTGSNYVTDVWLNGRYLGYHEGGFTPFTLEISEAMKEGEENLLAVRVDNVPWGSTEATVPYKVVDWWNYGGILRDVYVMFANKVHVARADVRYSLQGGSANLSIAVLLNNFGASNRNVSVVVCIERAEVNSTNLVSPYPSSLRVPGGELARYSVSQAFLPAGRPSAIVADFHGLRLEPWSPELPSLYLARVIVRGRSEVLDESFSQFGVRKVEFDSDGFKLNGVLRFLKGVARHEEHQLVGRTVTDELILQDLLMIQEIGADFLRTAHYPNHHMTYVLADRLGIMIWEEIPVYWFGEAGFRIQEERRISYQMLAEMIFRDFNRPSVVIWGLCNECDGDVSRITYLTRASELVRSMDSSRLMAEAMVFNVLDDTWERGALDLPAYNVYLGVFGGTLDMFDSAMKIFELKQPGNQILISEFGYWSGGASSEGEQANYFSRAWNLYSNHELVSGVVWWTAFDYDSFHTFNTFGALNWDRSGRKLLFGAIEEAYTKYSGKKPRDIWSIAWPYAAASLALVALAIGYVLAKRPKLRFHR